MYTIKKYRFALLYLFGLMMATSYQNCGGKVAFSSAQLASTSGTVDPGTPTTHQIQQVLALGVLAKNMDCVMCHTTIRGDVSGFGTMSLRADSMGQFFGNVYAADQKIYGNGMPSNYQDTTTDPNLVASVLPELISSNLVQNQTTQAYSINPEEQHNAFSGFAGFNGGGFGSMTFGGGGSLYTMTNSSPSIQAIAQSHIILNPFTNTPIVHDSDFPQLTPSSYTSQAVGSITLANGTVISSPITSNIILVNGQHIVNPSVSSPANSFNSYDPTCPAGNILKISGQVVVQGDLVIAGCITGQGTIYASGNIYVPDDIKMVNSAFPFPQSTDDSVLQAAALAATGKDMLSLGAAKFIIVGDVAYDIANDPTEDPIFVNNNTTLGNIDTWLSTGSVQQNQNLYVNSFLKKTYWNNDFIQIYGTTQTATPGAVAYVEANLYANMGIAAARGGTTESNQVINGSVMTPNLLLLSTGFNCYHYDVNKNLLTTNPFNGLSYASDNSQLNQDFRLKYTSLGYELLRVKTTTVTDKQNVQVKVEKANPALQHPRGNYIVPNYLEKFREASAL